MKQKSQRFARRAVAAALVLSAGAFAAPAMAVECQYQPSPGAMDVYQCTSSYTPQPDDILYWADSAGGMQWGGTQFTAHCDSSGMLNVNLYLWNGRRFVVVSGARGMCLSE
jgi:hypothetical protein